MDRLPAGTFVMCTYRRYRVDEAGRTIGPPEYFEAASDKAAVEYARGYEREQDVEVWVASRLVDLIECGRNEPQLRLERDADQENGNYTSKSESYTPTDEQIHQPALTVSCLVRFSSKNSIGAPISGTKTNVVPTPGNVSGWRNARETRETRQAGSSLLSCGVSS